MGQRIQSFWRSVQAILVRGIPCMKRVLFFALADLRLPARVAALLK